MRNPSAPSIAVIGGGPAGLMAAEIAASAGCRVTVYERMPSPARKFLLAGRGGLNLTHSEDIEQFMRRYREAAGPLAEALAALPPQAVRDWCEGLGQETFVGSSGKVFPKAMKASPLLRAWLRRLEAAGVDVRTRTRWLGFSAAGKLRFAAPSGEVEVSADATVLALGGASWPRLGSDGGWVSLLAAAGVEIAPLQPANCGFTVDWSERFRQGFEGRPLKRIAVAFGGEEQRGEALITAQGIEGGALYALSAPLRDAIAATGRAELHVDLRPDRSAEDLARKFARPRGKQSMATYLRKVANLSPVEIALLNEVTRGKLAELSPEALAALIKRLPLTLTGTALIATAISSAGGVRWDEVDAGLMLKRLPGVFVAGEMLDWEAPTGGYLLQACLATGALAGRGALNWIDHRHAGVHRRTS